MVVSQRRKVAVWGCGYLGATHAATLAEYGMFDGMPVQVVGIDVDPVKVATLAAGKVPFFEPGLDELLELHVGSGRLGFSTDAAAAVDSAVHFVCVGTPQRVDGPGADMRYVDAAVDAMVPFLRPGDVVVGKSTVPVGTAARLAGRVAARGATLLWNPEFLREGTAVADSLAPDRVVIGTSDTDAAAVQVLCDLYAPLFAAGSHLVVCDLATAELVKVAANSFLAVKVSYANALAEMCDRVGGDVVTLADALGFDVRIGRKFLNAGLGFGGGCLPKDIRAFGARATELGCSGVASFVAAADSVNLSARQRAVFAVEDALVSVGVKPADATVVVLGASFKPDSDDVRDSPALSVVTALEAAGVTVRLVDPQVRSVAGRTVTSDVEEALRDADAVVLATEWDEFRRLDPVSVASLLRHRVAVDGRNVWDPQQWQAAGFVFRGMGRAGAAAVTSPVG